MTLEYCFIYFLVLVDFVVVNVFPQHLLSPTALRHIKFKIGCSQMIHFNLQAALKVAAQTYGDKGEIEALRTEAEV